MSKVEHTPGPWNVDQLLITDKDGRVLADTWQNADGEGEANARLIAAAPSYDRLARLIVDADYEGLVDFAKDHCCLPPNIAHLSEHAGGADWSILIGECLEAVVGEVDGDR